MNNLFIIVEASSLMGDKVPRPRVTSQMTTTQVAKKLGIGSAQLLSWVEHAVLPPPNFIDSNGVRYFDQEWLKKAQAIAKSKKG